MLYVLAGRLHAVHELASRLATSTTAPSPHPPRRLLHLRPLARTAASCELAPCSATIDEVTRRPADRATRREARARRHEPFHASPPERSPRPLAPSFCSLYAVRVIQTNINITVHAAALALPARHRPAPLLLGALLSSSSSSRRFAGLDSNADFFSLLQQAAPLGYAAFFPPLPERPLDPAPPGSSQRTTGGGKGGGGLGPLATMGLLGAAASMMTIKEPVRPLSLSVSGDLGGARVREPARRARTLSPTAAACSSQARQEEPLADALFTLLPFSARRIPTEIEGVAAEGAREARDVGGGAQEPPQFGPSLLFPHRRAAHEVLEGLTMAEGFVLARMSGGLG